MSNSPSRTRIPPLLADTLFAFAALAVYFAWFYHRWPLWEDQGIYHYMAWGLGHGVIPFVDAITVDFPGPVLIHWVARLISGPSALGIHLLDTVFLLGLCVTTSVVLRRWGVPWPIRLLAFTAYLVCYFRTGNISIAQRESFALPPVALGLLPWLPISGNGRRCRLPALVGYGALVGVGLWVKPTLLLMPMALVAWALVTPGDPLRTRCLRAAAYLGGLLLVSAAFVAWLHATGSLAGFIHWGIVYAQGPYSQSKWPWPTRLLYTASRLWARGAPGPMALVAAGLLAVAVTKSRKALWRDRSAQVIAAGLLVAAALTSALLQGKTHCYYHFIPVQWSLCLLGAVLVAASCASERLFRARRLVVVVCVAALLGVGALAAREPHNPTAGTVLAGQLNPLLKPQETVVSFGFSTTLLSGLERRTPFPFVDSWVLYCAAPPNSEVRRAIMGGLERALQDPTVRYFVVERARHSKLNWFQDSPDEIIAATPEIQGLIQSGYVLDNGLTNPSFLVYSRSRPVP